MKRIVVALGGNALGNTPEEQEEIVKKTAISMVDIIEQGYELVIAHGNGPQVGMINNAFEEAHKINNNIPIMPFPECGAMSQSYIGFHLQNAIKNELNKRNINKNIVTIVTQVEVDKNDNAFLNPTKPIGPFYTELEATKLSKENGFIIKEDSGRGWRRVIASPTPINIIEKDVVKELIELNNIIITVGGGGIPVINFENKLKKVSAVIDKDFASAKLALDIDADCLLILTAVPQVAINFGKSNQKNLSSMMISQAEKYIEEGQFAPGSMLPKVKAAINFAKNNKISIIADLNNVLGALNGDSGTKIY
ncbi:carbamate kinase [Spiroplasma corruscae]|uniref:Carbamate kinase n=1 Tax=Spiroplasma corruscae TaxID=216934 RepID=A0A222EPI8_9MOLU|nr:carbamate kinase [Spiroplasma corruscae]ASP28448.1 carbamate kinase [Spiroplasma corruscae]